jgi:hypothetical protein
MGVGGKMQGEYIRPRGLGSLPGSTSHEAGRRHGSKEVSRCCNRMHRARAYCIGTRTSTKTMLRGPWCFKGTSKMFGALMSRVHRPINHTTYISHRLTSRFSAIYWEYHQFMKAERDSDIAGPQACVTQTSSQSSNMHVSCQATLCPKRLLIPIRKTRFASTNTTG